MVAGSALLFPYTFLSIINTIPANQDVWLCVLLSPIYMTILSLPALFFSNKFRGMTVSEITETVHNKFSAKLVLILLALFGLFIFIATLSTTTTFSSIYLLKSTPQWAILLLILVPVTYGSIKGAGTIARIAAVFVPLILGTIVLFFILGINKMQISSIMPILKDSTFWEINKGAMIIASRFTEIFIVYLFVRFLKKKESVNKTYFIALGIYLVGYLLILIPTLMVIGVDVAKISNNPYFLYTRQVGGYDFLQRLQSFNTLAWLTGTMCKLMFYNYMSSLMISEISKKIKRNIVTIILSFVGFAYCLVPLFSKQSNSFLLSSDKVLPYVVVPYGFILPIIYIIIYLFRKKKIEKILQEKKVGKYAEVVPDQ